MNAPDHSSLQDTLPLVLVVDDEARSIDAIRRNLEEDFRVLTATSADEARTSIWKSPLMSSRSECCIIQS